MSPAEPRREQEIRADLAERLVSEGARLRLVSDTAQLLDALSAALAAKEAAEAQRDELRRVRGTDYEIVAYDGEAHVARHYEATSYDSPPEAELMGSVGDLIRKLDEMLARAERAEAQRDAALLAAASGAPLVEVRALWKAALEREGNLAAAVADVVWKATQFGTTEDGDTFAYIVPKGAMHRLVGVAQSNGAHVPVAFQAALAAVSPPRSEQG